MTKTNALDKNWSIDGQRAYIHYLGGYMAYSTQHGDYLAPAPKATLVEYTELGGYYDRQRGINRKEVFDDEGKPVTDGHGKPVVLEIPIIDRLRKRTKPESMAIGKPLKVGDKVKDGQSVCTIVELTDAYVALANENSVTLKPWSLNGFKLTRYKK